MEDMKEVKKRIDEKTRAYVEEVLALPPGNSKPLTRRRPRTSLDEVTDTQEKADDLMRQIIYLRDKSRSQEGAS